ncbi:MAG: hypothetical protein Q8O52_15810 [Sulfuritalea sp.]|nr:hypothetical protein [Sulfuritalea sp.]
MHAIEFEAIPRQHAIQIPEGVRLADGQMVRVLLLVDDAKAVPAQTSGSHDVFRLLTELSDDFMTDGRQQPPLQARDDL